MIVSAGDSETFSFATPIGIGLINSAINLTRSILFDKPDFLLFIGSAGSYGKYNIFDIVESATASNLELSFLDDKSYTVLDNVISIENSSLETKTIVNSSNYITTDIDTAKKYNNYNIGIENMEFFSVLSVAKEFGIPAGGIFVVTNYTDKNAHEEFVKNHSQAMDILIDHLKSKKIIDFLQN
jgi:nucleoside phosphorylase